MSLNKDSELRKAILSLPQQEKDKLLVRLIGKDPLLMEQLHFRLLEDESDLDHRVSAATAQLLGIFEGLSRPSGMSVRYLSHQLVQALKHGSGIVNKHLAITKDKMSEVKLRILLIQQSFAHFGQLFGLQTFGQNDKLLRYQANRIKYTLAVYDRLHEDLQFEYRDDLNEILTFAYQSGLMDYMKELGLPKEV